MIELLTRDLIKAAIDVAKNYAQKKIADIEEDKDKILDELDIPSEKVEKISSAFVDGSVAVEIDVDMDISLTNIEEKTKSIKEWCSTINYKDFTESKSLNDIYIHLNTYLIPLARQEDAVEKEKTVSLEQAIIEYPGHVLIQGQPGAGKTTAVKKILNLLLFENHNGLAHHRFPILIRLREIRPDKGNKDIIIGELASLFHFSFNVNVSNTLLEGQSIFEDMLWERKLTCFLRFLDSLNPLIILDGLDEITDLSIKAIVEKEIAYLCRECHALKLIVTCRTGEFRNTPAKIREFEIAPLSKQQVVEFAGKWIENVRKRNQFVAEVMSSPFADTALKPLLLTRLCVIYIRTGAVPERPKTVYKQTVTLLLEDWDNNREVRRGNKHVGFDIHEKFEFLCNLSYYFSVILKKYVMTEDELIDAYVKLSPRFKLREAEIDEVISEIESQTGLFIQSGSHQFEFSHKSLQEYLAAEHIIRMTVPPNSADTVSSISSELAIAVAISSEPNEYLHNLVQGSFVSNNLEPEFYYSFLNRLGSEKVGFFDDESLFVSVLTIISLWFCKGNVPKRNKILGASHSDFVGGFAAIENKSLPPFSEVIPDQSFYRRLLKLTASADTRDDVGPTPEIISISTKRLKSSFFKRKHFVIPKILFTEAEKKLG